MPKITSLRDLRLILLAVVAGISFGCDEFFDESEIDQLSEKLRQTIHNTLGADGVTSLLLPASEDLAAISADPNNVITHEKVALGKLLFHETALAVRPVLEVGFQQYSCASCHNARAGFQSGLKQGLAEGGTGFGSRGEERRRDLRYDPSQIRSEPVRPPATLNVAWTHTVGWSGVYGATGNNVGTEDRWSAVPGARHNALGFAGVETRSIEALDRYGFSTEGIAADSTYQSLFAAAFPGLGVDETLTRRTTGLALAAYLRTITASKAPFQQWLSGNRLSMGISSLKGAILFFGKGACSTCHNGPSLASESYHVLGMADLSGIGVVSSGMQIDSASAGRAAFTGRPDDMYAYRTPQLYNLSDAGVFGHGGSFRSLRQVVAYKNRARSQSFLVDQGALDPAFQALQLSDQEIDDLTAFLSEALRDPDLRRYEPDSVPSGKCFPNGDEETRRAVACR